MSPQVETIKTRKYLDMYIKKVVSLGHLTPGQIAGIYQEFMKEEQAWLASMGSEYEEIMQAQDVVEKLDGHSRD